MDEKLVIDYTKLSMNEVLDLPCFEFWKYLHDAVVFNCNQTEKGREYLENAWLLTQTSPDRASLRKQFGK